MHFESRQQIEIDNKFMHEKSIVIKIIQLTIKVLWLSTSVAAAWGEKKS